VTCILVVIYSLVIIVVQYRAECDQVKCRKQIEDVSSHGGIARAMPIGTFASELSSNHEYLLLFGSLTPSRSASSN
jgi:hypothetical protein